MKVGKLEIIRNTDNSIEFKETVPIEEKKISQLDNIVMTLAKLNYEGHLVRINRKPVRRQGVATVINKQFR